MKTERINGHEFEFYDSIDSLPINQFHLYSKYALVLSGIGDGIEGIDSHINKIASFIKEDPQRAVRELLNYRRNLYSVLMEEDYKHKANLCLVKSVDGEKWTDYTDSGISRLYEMVTDATEREMAEIEASIREKLDNELMTYFPEIFDSSLDKNYTELLRRRAMLQLSEIIDNTDQTEAIRALDSRILSMSESKNFEGKESAEIAFDKQFETMCLVLAKEFGGIVKNYTVMEFYTANRMLKEEQDQMNKMSKKK